MQCGSCVNTWMLSTFEGSSRCAGFSTQLQQCRTWLNVAQVDEQGALPQGALRFMLKSGSIRTFSALQSSCAPDTDTVSQQP